MQQHFIKNVYNEFIYCDPSEHLLAHNKLTRPNNHICQQCRNYNRSSNNGNIYANQNIGEYTAPIQQEVEPECKTNMTQSSSDNSFNLNETQPKIIYDEETFNQIELRGFITKQLLEQSLERGSNLFHIAQDVFDRLCDKYNQFKEIHHTLTTEFDNTIECIIETGKELAKKIAHIIYELYLAVANKDL